MPGPGMELIGEEEIQEVLEVLRGGYLHRYGDDTTNARSLSKPQGSVGQQCCYEPCPQPWR